MSRYFSEAMNEHPEFQRLNQRIRDLEKTLKGADELIDYLKDVVKTTESQNKEFSRRALKAEAALRVSEEKIQDYKEEMEAFNNSSPFAKMFHHFVID